MRSDLRGAVWGEVVGGHLTAGDVCTRSWMMQGNKPLKCLGSGVSGGEGAQPVQRPWGRTHERRGGQGGDGAGRAGPWGPREALDLPPPPPPPLREAGALEGCGQRRVGPDPGAHRCPLETVAGRTDVGEGRSLGWGGGDRAGPGDELRGSGTGAGFGQIVRVQVADGKAHVWCWGPAVLSFHVKQTWRSGSC